MRPRLLVREIDGRIQIAIDPEGPLILSEGKTLPDARMRAVGTCGQLMRAMDDLGTSDVQKVETPRDGQSPRESVRPK